MDGNNELASLQQLFCECMKRNKEQPHDPNDVKAHREIPVFAIIAKNRKSENYPYFVLKTLGKFYKSRIKCTWRRYRNMKVMYAVQCIPKGVDLRAELRKFPYLEFEGSSNFKFKTSNVSCAKLLKDIDELIKCLHQKATECAPCAKQ